MGLLTREEEKRFPREQEILTVESIERTEDENRPPSIPTHTTARGSVQVNVVQRWEKRERRLVKRRKVLSDDEEELARSVEKTVAPIVNTSKVAASEVTRPVEIKVPSGVSIEVPTDIPAEPLKEETELISPIFQSSEQPQSARGKETPQLKMNEYLEKESTSSEEIQELVVARIGGTVVEAEGITLLWGLLFCFSLKINKT
ncbi:hypothetical protein AXG93_3671s1030 [Marchantia polymorpha subsp. ruderalis]|uniref:Uncharacterized protein n=1 Tax=Marchantia polymorpha subsp. ruderalis TaxID=1480154 RepID=A0A176WHL6_MARPO|nr:hypothetical protein AXG93_3671s1030 [Marchantia polymorpha subsp. ruderalis]